MTMKRILQPEVMVNLIGAVGYMVLVAAWTLFLAVLLSFWFDSYSAGQSGGILHPSPAKSVANPPSTAVWVAGYIITGLVVIVTVAIVAMLPYFIGRWGSRLVKALMKLCRIDMTRRQLLLVRGILATIPVMGLMFIYLFFRPDDITFAAMYGGTVALSALTIGLFLLQTFLARRFKIDISRLW